MSDQTTYICAHCRRNDVGSMEGGYAAVRGTWVCHPNGTNRPDCYSLVTNYKHPMPCTKCPTAPTQ